MTFVLGVYTEDSEIRKKRRIVEAAANIEMGALSGNGTSAAPVGGHGTVVPTGAGATAAAAPAPAVNNAHAIYAARGDDRRKFSDSATTLVNVPVSSQATAPSGSQNATPAATPAQAQTSRTGRTSATTSASATTSPPTTTLSPTSTPASAPATSSAPPPPHAAHVTQRPQREPRCELHSLGGAGGAKALKREKTLV